MFHKGPTKFAEQHVAFNARQQTDGSIKRLVQFAPRVHQVSLLALFQLGEVQILQWVRQRLHGHAEIVHHSCSLVDFVRLGDEIVDVVDEGAPHAPRCRIVVHHTIKREINN